MQHSQKDFSLYWKKFGICFIAYLLLFTACKKNYNSEEIQKGPILTELESWYLKNKTSGLDKQLPGIQPDWDQMSTIHAGNSIIYEIDVLNPNHIITAETEIETSQIEEYQKRNRFRLVIVKNIETGNITGNFMNLVSDSPTQDFASVRYKNVGSFSGIVQYYQLNGKYNVGWHYKQGKIDIKYTRYEIPTPGSKVAVMIPCGSSPRYATFCFSDVNGGADICTNSIVGYDIKMCDIQSFEPDYGENTSGGYEETIQDPDPVLDTDPCVGKTNVKKTAMNTRVSIALDSLKKMINGSSLDPNASESGTAFKKTGLGSADGYRASNITTDAGTSWFAPSFTWNITDGFTIGEAHTHMDGTAPSPSDIMHMAADLAKVQSSGVGIDYYKANVSTTVVTPWGNFVVTVKNWDGFLAEYNSYQNTPKSQYFAAYEALGGGGNLPTGLRFLLKFGAFLNLYKSDPGSNDYEPLEMINNNSAVGKKPCNN
ncbi:hypothetical protein ACJVDH_00350 [Pedobacter sp. AW1-32]|uniref:hypothetical protein n=1 Tax=Pedobacter sp. AW1-32 TaxID=3383026 RepID=UPI003FEFEBCA